MQRALTLKVLVAQYPLFVSECLADHVGHDRLPLGLSAGVDFNVRKNSGHRLRLPFVRRFSGGSDSIQESPA